MGLLLGIFIVLLLLAIYCQLTKGVYNQRPDQTGKVILITGASAGIGLETALQLARLNATVILVCRNERKAKSAVEFIKKITGNENVKYYLCDVALMASVRQFAKEFLQNESKLDVLILNAGVLGSKGRHLTPEGLEIHLATNHLGHFLLTNLLLDLIVKSGKSRIVVLSSIVHPFGKIDFENLNCEKYVPHPILIYSNTKLMNVVFAKELSRRLKGTQVTSNSLNPGYVRTTITEKMPTFMDRLFKLSGHLYGKSVEEGAQTSVYLSIAKEVEGVTGKYFQDCQIASGWVPLKASDKELGRKLWDVSEKLCDMSLNTSYNAQTTYNF